MSQPLHTLTLSGLRSLLRDGAVTPVEAARALLDRIAAVDGQIGGYLSFDADALLADAAKADPSLPLGGIPISIKDILNVAGQACGCASKILTGYRAPYDATAIARLKAAGAIPFGRVNMDEFAMGSSTENSSIQKTANPWALDRAPGGSSGGSAAVVAADEAYAALGTDTGGSIRQPAAFCGCVGLKPSYGRISRYGLVAFASSLDQIGPITKTVEDSALLLQAMAGRDEMDSTSLDEPVPDYRAGLNAGVAGLRVGMPKEYFAGGLDPEVQQAVETAVRHYEGLGAKIVEISLPHTEHAVAVYYILATAEASANLARFDGVRYGHRAEHPADLLDHYCRTREEGFGPEVKRRIILGTYVLSSGYYDAYYSRAQKVRTLIRRDFENAFAQTDLLICPTSPTPAFKLGERTADPLQMYLADIFTIAANLGGLCGISLPCGFTSGNPRLPIGLQLMGRPFDEARLLQAAHAYEQSTPWHKERPTL